MYKIGKVLPVVLAFSVFAVQANPVTETSTQTQVPISIPTPTQVPVTPAQTQVPALTPATDVTAPDIKGADVKVTPENKGFFAKTKEASSEYLTSARAALSKYAEKANNFGTDIKFVQDHKSAYVGLQAAKLFAAAAVVYGTYKAAQYAYSKYYKHNKTQVQVVR